MSEHRYPGACRLCGSAQATLIDEEEQEHRTFSILRCDRCALIFVPEDGTAVSPDYVALSDGDIDPQHVWLQTEHKRDAHLQALSALGKYSRPAVEGRRPTALEVGCGVGGWLAALPNHYEKFAFDASAAQVRLASSRFPNCRVANTIAEYELALGRALPPFDLIALWDVLEHVRNPLPFLMELRNALHPDGVVLAAVPAAGPMLAKSRLLRWGWPRSRFSWSPREHVAYYSPRTIRQAFTRAGFEPLEVGAVTVYPRPLSPFEVARRAAFALTKFWLNWAPQIYVIARKGGVEDAAT